MSIYDGDGYIMGYESIPDYYKILNVSEKATQDEIKKSWRSLARKYHPDAQRNKTPAEQKDAEEKMKKINEAYSVIGDVEKRKKYDNMRSGPNPFAGGNPFSGNAGNGGGYQGYSYTTDGNMGNMNWNDILEQIFGVDLNTGQQKHDSTIFDKDFSFGNFKNTMPERAEECQMSVPLATVLTHGTIKATVPSGKTVNLKMSDKIRNGSTIKLKGLGSNGVNLLVHITIEMPPEYTLEGDDIIGTLPLRFDQAILGSQVSTTLPSGKQVIIKVPQNTGAHKSFVFNHEGLGTDGRCILHTEITIPEHLSEKAMNTLRQLSQEL